MDAERLFERNLAFFRERFPAAAEAVRSPRTEGIAPMVENGRTVNIAIGEHRLYPEPSPAFAGKQIEAYFAAPFRLVAGKPQDIIAESSRRLFSSLDAVYRARHKTAPPPIPLSDNCYLVMIGIGLGDHLAEAIRRAHARHVILLEPQADFLRLSMDVIDWTELVRQAERLGRSVDLVVDGDPVRLLDTFERIVTERGFAFVDGTYIYMHYPSFATERLRDDVRARAELYVVSRGYYEDEIKMIRNCGGNLLRHRFRLIDGTPRPRRREPVFIVGSGPSVDAAIPFIKKWRDHAIVFGAGSASQVLLHHGIIPDFHVELENEAVIVDKIEHIAALNPDAFPNGRSEAIRLIASTTVNPKVLDHFAQSLLFFRDSVSSTRTFGARCREIRGAAPFVANTSLALASVLGFGEVYLFGCDCGSRRKDKFHSDQTIYHTTQLFKGVGDVNFSRQAPGNFGGIVNSDLTFYWSAKMIEDIIALYALKAVNCSDGVLIAGAQPRAPGALRFDTPPLDKAAVLADIDRASPVIEPATWFTPDELDGYLRHWDDLIAVIEAGFASSLAEDEDFPAFHERLGALLAALPGNWGHVGSMVIGSFLMYEKIGLFYVNRAADITRRDMLKTFIAEAGRLCVEICRAGRGIFAEIRDAHGEHKPA